MFAVAKASQGHTVARPVVLKLCLYKSLAVESSERFEWTAPMRDEDAVYACACAAVDDASFKQAGTQCT